MCLYVAIPQAFFSSQRVHCLKIIRDCLYALLIPQKLGVVRCYWALLRPRYTEPAGRLDLQFVQMDPVLSAHLAKQKMSLMGRGIMEFIHPHERERASKHRALALRKADQQRREGT